ncbi:MAG: aminoacyl-tRNA hydrolase [Candidatus Daviesbacteria bacterium]|nr:aminoacyl-tRNA hydrolase [Candidatus Daviesbacteria bacterium]
MKLIVGLGNPGEEHEKTRHNLGFMVVEELVKKIGAGNWSENKNLKSEVVKTLDLIIAKPQTYMNNSGMGVKLLADYFKVGVEDIIIVHDELDLPLGKIKVRSGGAAAGHHGVESIIKALNDDKFIRVRLGIGNLRTQSAEHGASHIDPNHYVLESFMAGEKSKVKHLLKQAVETVELLLEKGLEKAQNQYN